MVVIKSTSLQLINGANYLNYSTARKTFFCCLGLCMNNQQFLNLRKKNYEMNIIHQETHCLVLIQNHQVKKKGSTK